MPVTGSRTEEKPDLRRFHMRPDKAAVYEDLSPVVACDGTGFAHVFDGELAAVILKSPEFEVIPLAEVYEKISQKTGLDFQATVSVCRKMALFVNGAGHKAVRSEMAAIFASSRHQQKAALESCADQILEQVLLSGQTIDLVHDLTRPMYHVLTSVLIGVDWEKPHFINDYPRIMDAIYSLNRRRALNSALEAAIADHCDPDVDPATKMALLVLGHDTFIGTIAISLWKTIERHPGVALNNIPWPEKLPATSLPYVERRAIRDWECDGFNIKAGQAVRIVVEASAAYGPLKTQDCMFGKGRHLCLGRPVTEMAWQIITDRLKKSTLSAKPLALTFREPDSIFCFPTKSEVQFHV